MRRRALQAGCSSRGERTVLKFAPLLPDQDDLHAVLFGAIQPDRVTSKSPVTHFDWPAVDRLEVARGLHARLPVVAPQIDHHKSPALEIECRGEQPSRCARRKPEVGCRWLSRSASRTWPSQSPSDALHPRGLLCGETFAPPPCRRTPRWPDAGLSCGNRTGRPVDTGNGDP